MKAGQLTPGDQFLIHKIIDLIEEGWDRYLETVYA